MLKSDRICRISDLVQGEREVCFELLQAGRDVSALLAPVDARNEQVYEPGEAVLVHRFDVGQVRDAEEENLTGVSDRGVTSANLQSSWQGLGTDR